MYYGNISHPFIAIEKTLDSNNWDKTVYEKKPTLFRGRQVIIENPSLKEDSSTETLQRIKDLGLEDLLADSNKDITKQYKIIEKEMWKSCSTLKRGSIRINQNKGDAVKSLKFLELFVLFAGNAGSIHEDLGQGSVTIKRGEKVGSSDMLCDLIYDKKIMKSIQIIEELRSEIETGALKDKVRHKDITIKIDKLLKYVNDLFSTNLSLTEKKGITTELEIATDLLRKIRKK